MSDTNACGHSQLMGQREFCPDCGLSRTEVLVEACAPFLKDDETPAECIRRNRKDVDGCLSMLIDEKRENDALRAERDSLQKRVTECESVMLHYGMETEHSCMCQFNDDTGEIAGECVYHEKIRAERDEAVALLLETCERMSEAETTSRVLTGQLPEYSEGQQMLRSLAAKMGDSVKRIRAFRAADSASGEGEK